MALPLIPILGYTALAGGVGVGGTALASRDDNAAKLLGLTAKQRSQGMAYDRTQLPGERIELSPMDWLGNLVTGQDLSDLESAALKRSNATINQNNSQLINDIRTELDQSGLDIDRSFLDINANQTEKEFVSKLKGAAASLNALSEVKAAGHDVSGLMAGRSTLPSSGAILGDLAAAKTRKADARIKRSDQIQDNAIARQTRLDERAANQQDIANSFARSQQEYRQWKDAKDDEWRRWSYQQQLADKRESRADRKQALIMQMQQSDLDRSYMRERDERADARADRKQRTAMLMQMVQGLSKLGYGMAI